MRCFFRRCSNSHGRESCARCMEATRDLRQRTSRNFLDTTALGMVRDAFALVSCWFTIGGGGCVSVCACMFMCVCVCVCSCMHVCGLGVGVVYVFCAGVCVCGGKGGGGFLIFVPGSLIGFLLLNELPLLRMFLRSVIRPALPPPPPPPPHPLSPPPIIN